MFSINASRWFYANSTFDQPLDITDASNRALCIREETLPQVWSWTDRKPLSGRNSSSRSSRMKIKHMSSTKTVSHPWELNFRTCTHRIVYSLGNHYDLRILYNFYTVHLIVQLFHNFASHSNHYRPRSLKPGYTNEKRDSVALRKLRLLYTMIQPFDIFYTRWVWTSLSRRQRNRVTYLNCYRVYGARLFETRDQCRHKSLFNNFVWLVRTGLT